MGVPAAARAADVTSMGVTSSMIRSAAQSRPALGTSVSQYQTLHMPSGRVTSVVAHGNVPRASARFGAAPAVVGHRNATGSSTDSGSKSPINSPAPSAQSGVTTPVARTIPPNAIRVEQGPATVHPEMFGRALDPRVIAALRGVAGDPSSPESMHLAGKYVARLAEDDQVLAQALRELAEIYRQMYDAEYTHSAAGERVAASGFAVAAAPYPYSSYAYPAGYSYPYYGARSYLPYYGGCGYAYGAGTCYTAPYMAGWAQRYMPLYASWPSAVLAPATSTWWWWV